MATYAIGDIHGCYRTLQRLLEIIGYDRSRDRIWLVGDLVNRGRDSLEVLRWAMREQVVLTLGNHDLFLLARSYGVGRERHNDTLDRFFTAPDRFDLIDWLRARPLMHLEGRYALIHAGLHPNWTVDQALRLAREAERALQAEGLDRLLAGIRINNSIIWNDAISGRIRTKLIINVFTRMRLCSQQGQLLFRFHAAKEAAIPPGYLPWFRIPHRRGDDVTILFGHWSSLGLHEENGTLCLDSGCVYGGALTALRLEDRKLFQQPWTEEQV